MGLYYIGDNEKLPSRNDSFRLFPLCDIDKAPKKIKTTDVQWKLKFRKLSRLQMPRF